MYRYLILPIIALLLAACDARVVNPPTEKVIEKNTTVITPPVQEPKVENKTIIITPPVTSTTETKKTTTTTE